jgi:hypothetical protein
VIMTARKVLRNKGCSHQSILSPLPVFTRKIRRA